MSNPFDDTVADEYENPFAGGNYNDSMPATSSQATQPQQTTPPPASPPIASPPKEKTVFSNPFKSDPNQFLDPVTQAPITEADLERREQALARREREIESKEQQIQNGTLAPPTSRKNFPPFLRIYAYHPDEDLPENSRQLAKILFYMYLGIGLIYLLNWIGCLACLGAGSSTSSPATKIVISSIDLFILFPVSWEISYFVFYKALAEGRGLKFVCFLITYIIWGIILIVEAIGFDDGGSVGWIQMIDLFSGTGGGAKFAAVLGLIFSICATGMIALMFFIFIKLIKFYRSEGLQKKSFQEAAKFTAERANENRDVLIEAARENPELVQHAAGAAVSGGYTQFA